jgi:hypothetical protein
MRKRFAIAAFLLAVLGFSAYASFSGQPVQITDDGTPPPPSFP